jgi:Tol biopolymer transport system component
LFTTPVEAPDATFVGTGRDLHSCVWSPSGAWIACVSGNYLGIEPGALFGNIAPSAIVMFRASGGAAEEITQRNDANFSPAWYRGDDQLYYVSTRDGSRDIYAQDLTRDGKAQGPPTRVSTGLDVQSMSISRTGRFAYSAFASRSNIWSIPIPTESSVTSDAAQPVTTGNQVVEGVRVSRDHRWLVYDSNIRGASQIFRVPLAGGTPDQLTNETVPFFSGDLSPDGQSVVYHSWRTGSRELEIRPTTGGPAQRLTHDNRQATSPVFSPDGRAIAYWEQVLPYQRRVLRRDATGTWVPGPPSPGWLPHWSPDGRFLAFIGPHSRVSVASSDSGRGRVLYPRVEADQKPEDVEWSDDGRTLYFKTHDPTGRTSVWSIPASGGAPRLLVRFTDLNRPSSRPELAVGGGRLFFTLTERESDIWTAEAKVGSAK